MTKIRADKFVVIASKENLMKIQEQVQKQWDESIDVETVNGANILLHTYGQVAFDEGYRQAVGELKEDFPDTVKPLKKRRRGFVEYVEEGDMKDSMPLFRRRMKSKRQRKNRTQYCAEKGIEDSEESFLLSMVINTHFEAGYIKGSSIEIMAEHICQNPEMAKLSVELFNELFPGIS